MQQEKQDPERWKKNSLYGMRTDKPHPESTSKAARERTPDSRDRPAYRDGRLLLAQQRQLAYQKDSHITPNLSDSSISKSRSKSRRLGSDVNERKFNTSELGVPKGGGGQDEASESQQQMEQRHEEERKAKREELDTDRAAFRGKIRTNFNNRQLDDWTALIHTQKQEIEKAKNAAGGSTSSS